jgi:hypothetical protein
MYREDSGRKATVQAFLSGCSSPPRLDEGTSTVMAMAAETVAEAAETFKTPKRWVSSIGANKMLIPSFEVRSYQHGAYLPR